MRKKAPISFHLSCMELPVLKRGVASVTPVIQVSIRRWEMTWKPATRGNSERCYLQVDFGLARVLWKGMVDGCQHLLLIPKVGSLNPAF